MKTNELRIGNFINHEDFNVPMMVSGVLLDDNRIRVAAIGGQSTVMVGGSWSPILITEEWLLKFGFECELKKGNQNDYRVYALNGFTYNTNHGWWLFGKQLKVQPIHAHQLQNLYFALTNEELTIKP
jgi:hypothetical protein